MQTNQPQIPTIKSKDIVGYQNVAVVTTRMLADYYGTETRNIRVNFDRNKKWFLEGESYFKIEGEELKTFRLNTTKSSVQIGGRARILYLWTEEGALFHAKMLNTDQAWQIYKMLVANYFDAHAKKMYREASRKARQASIEWQKIRQIGIDDGRIPLTDVVPGFYLMYLRQKGGDLYENTLRATLSDCV